MFRAHLFPALISQPSTFSVQILLQQTHPLNIDKLMNLKYIYFKNKGAIFELSFRTQLKLWLPYVFINDKIMSKHLQAQAGTAIILISHAVKNAVTDVLKSPV